MIRGPFLAVLSFCDIDTESKEMEGKVTKHWIKGFVT